MEIISKVDLSTFNNRFDTDTFGDLKKKNYIYGKNGTGKSTIAQAIQNQYGESHQIFLFNGFEGIIGESTELDAISLGKENAENQKQINELKSKITSLTQQTNSNSPASLEVIKNQNEYDKQFRLIEDFFTKSAREIGKSNNPVFVNARQYNKRNFRSDMNEAKKLETNELERFKQKASAKQIPIHNAIKLPVLNSRGFENATREILNTPLTPSTTIKELVDNPNKKEFALDGMHLHNKGDRCAFCGNLISSDRWEELDSFFSKTVSDFEKRIANAITKVKLQQDVVKAVAPLSPDDFFDHLHDRVNILNERISTRKVANIEFLGSLIKELLRRKDHEFSVLQLAENPLPSDFNDIQIAYEQLYNENKAFADNLSEERKSAIKQIRLDTVSNLVDEFKFHDQNVKLHSLDVILQSSNHRLDELNQQLSINQASLEKLISEARSERLAVQKMNHCLDDLGNQSFKLKYVPNSSGQNGLYRVSDQNGTTRGISQLSTGEKNLVAFLYFMNSLESAKTDDAKERVVIFDDPINSNDDTIQFLIIGLIRALHKKENCPQLFVFTHNNNFYSQVTPPHHNYKSGAVGYFRLTKVDSETHIQQVTNGNEDLGSLYDELWKELHFAYDADKPTFMWNIMRRILETYNRFVYANESLAQLADNQLSGGEDEVFILALTKGLNENSHIADETDIDISGFSKQTLLMNFKRVFEKLDTEEHFKSHWN